VTGGAGYIGSHVSLLLKERGYFPIIYDDFSRGNRFVAERLALPVVEGSILDEEKLTSALREYKPVAVMHFAALAYVGESVKAPLHYYEVNLEGSRRLLSAMNAAAVPFMIFSSTCATYGVPAMLPITEETPQIPISPYGHSKLFVEKLLGDTERAHQIRSVRFRYFNAAGADDEVRIGEVHKPETHLIPLALEAASGIRELEVFGDDYATRDGTCVRDYIHVVDIADAHVRGLNYLLEGGSSMACNLGNGQGYSVREVITTVEKVTGRPVPYVIKPRRPGDPPTLIAEAQKAFAVLGWKPRFPTLESMITPAWKWHRQYLSTYGTAPL